MVETNGLRGNLLRESLEAAARAQLGSVSRVGGNPSQAFDQLVKQITEGVESANAVDGPRGSSLADLVREGLGSVQGELRAAEELPEQVVSGQVKSFEELAAQVKRADLTFRFTLEIRNRLVDAYREVMRMTV
jgi:flagellar hook-basal body complex protein FliE